MESDKTNIIDFGLWTLINQKFNYRGRHRGRHYITY